MVFYKDFECILLWIKASHTFDLFALIEYSGN